MQVRSNLRPGGWPDRSTATLLSHGFLMTTKGLVEACRVEIEDKNRSASLKRSWLAMAALTFCHVELWNWMALPVLFLLSDWDYLGFFLPRETTWYHGRQQQSFEIFLFLFLINLFRNSPSTFLVVVLISLLCEQEFSTQPNY